MNKILYALAVLGLVQSELAIDAKTKSDVETGRDLDQVIKFLLRPAVPLTEVIMN
jgi:hypothetical protein